MAIRLHTIGVAWYDKKATLKECTHDILGFIENLKAFDSLLEQWFEQGNSIKEALTKPIEFDYDYLKSRICKTCKEDEYPEYSFRISMWNGKLKEGEDMLLSASLGNPIPKINNSNCILRMPSCGVFYEKYKDVQHYHKLQELFVEYWKPQKIMNSNGDWIDL